MRKISTILASLALLISPLLFTSCDDDPWYDDYWYDDWRWGQDYNNRPDDGNVDNQDFFVAMAQTLAGQWRGDMMAYELDDQGHAIDSLYMETDIEFKQYNDQSVSGTGTQWDFIDDDDTADFTRDFTWYIDTTDGTIYLVYKEQQENGTYTNYTMSIDYDDLNLDNRTFTGYLWSSDGREVDDFYFDRYSQTRASKPKGAKKIKLVMK